MTKRLAIVAHWDPRGDAAPHFLRLLDQLAEVFDKVVVASPSPLDQEAVHLISERAELIRRGNYGYDFGSWRDGLERENWASGYDEVLLTNDSYVGFFRPLEEIIVEMSSRPFDVWGITRTRRVADHIQSYFLYFNKTVVQSRTFRDYWTGMKLAKDRRDAILKHEVGVSRSMVEGGFRLGSYFEPTIDERLDATRRGVHWLTRRSREFPARFPQATDNYFEPTNASDPEEADLLNWSSAFADYALDFGRLPVLKFDVLRYDPFWLDSKALLDVLERTYPNHMESVREYIRDTSVFYTPREYENGAPASLSNEEKARVRTYTGNAISGSSPMPSRPKLTAEQAGDIKLVINSGVTIPEYYAAQLGSKPMSVALTAEHYVLEGDSKGYSVNPLLDVSLIRDAVNKPGRPAIASWLRSRNWNIHTSRVWWPGSYIGENPRSVQHAGGPIGHLTAAVNSNPDTLVEFSAAAGRAFPWRNALAGMLRSAEKAELRGRSTRARTLTRDLPHPDRVTFDWKFNSSGPMISIIMPVLNRPNGLRVAVESVLAQTWSNWELLIVDDGSDDDTLLVAQSLAAADSRICVEARDHGGVSAARNAGLGIAAGEWIAFLDSDNTWLPNFLEDMVKGLSAQQAEAGYASLSLTDEKGTTYRSGAPEGANLLAGNWIDLNVLVAKKSSLNAIGGFDETLRRAVDYDLVIRLSQLTNVIHIPTLGAAYDNYASNAERISTSEAYGWNTAVRLRNTPKPPNRGYEHGATVIAVLQSGDAPATFVTRLHRIRDFARGGDVQVIIAAVGCSLDEQNAIVMATATYKNIRVIPFESHDTFALVANVCARYVNRDITVFIDPRAVFESSMVAALADYCRREPDRVVAPVLLSNRSTIHSIGATLAGAKRLPSLLLAGHSTDEIISLPDLVRVPLLHGRTFAIRSATYGQIGGIDPLLTNEMELESLCARLLALDPPVEALTATTLAVHLQSPERCFRNRDTAGSRVEFRSISASAPTCSTSELYSSLGLEAAGWRGMPFGDSRRDEAILIRQRQRIRVNGRDVPRLRWSIKISSPEGPKGEKWGDTHFARSLAKSLRSLGQYVTVDSREHQHRPHEYLDDVVLVIRGLDEFEPTRGPLSYMWLISHPDLVGARELSKYERVFAASTSWSASKSLSWGFPIEALLQCTDASIFHPEGAKRGSEIVFVGNSRDIPRPAVIEPMRAGIPLKLYGGGWERFVPADSIAAPYVANDKVRDIYESAAVVLNDHWVDMAREGFISNRIFDVVASGGRVLSDHVDGISEIFGSAVRTFHSVIELPALLLSDVDVLFGNDEEVSNIGRLIRERHSFRARAWTLLERAMEDLGE